MKLKVNWVELGISVLVIIINIKQIINKYKVIFQQNKVYYFLAR